MTASSWIDIGCLDDIPRRGARRILVPALGDDEADAVAIFRTADDEIFALIDRCPHKAGPLSEGIVQGDGVACPLHGWVIDLASGEAEAPDIGCVRTIPVRRDVDRILISLTATEAAAPRRKAA